MSRFILIELVFTETGHAPLPKKLSMSASAARAKRLTKEETVDFYTRGRRRFSQVLPSFVGILFVLRES